MKKIVVFIFALCSFQVFAQKQFVVDANAVTRPLSGSFNSINVATGIKLYISQSNKEVLAVSAAEQKNIDNIVTKIVDGELFIYYDKRRTQYNERATVYIGFNKLEQIKASGASNITVAGEVALPSLNINMSGASNIKGDLTIDDLTIKLSGASDAKLTGQIKNITIESSGASDVKGYDLIAQNCTVRSSGASDVNITVQNELSVNASGASSVRYKGSATLKYQDVSGASDVKKVD